MNTAKSYKLILILTAICLAVAMLFGGASLIPAKAETSKGTNASIYFSGSVTSDNMKFEGGAFVATVKDGDTLSIDSRLIISDFALDVVIPQGVTVKTTFESDSFYVNGNKKGSGETATFDTKIVNTLAITSEEGKLSSKLNERTLLEKAFTGDSAKFTVSVENGYIQVGGDVQADTETDAYYRLKEVDEKTSAKIAFAFSGIAEGQTAQFKIISIDQKASDSQGTFKQTFETNDNGVITKTAQPRVAINDTFYARNVAGEYTANKKENSASSTPYSFTYTIYSLFGGVYNSDLNLASANSDLVWINQETNKLFRFKPAAVGQTVDIEIYRNVKEDNETVKKVLETISVNVYDETTDTEKPVYDTSDALAKESFEYQLKRAYSNEDGTSVALGSDVKIPSMRDLVFDNYTSYDDMQKTVYYTSRETSGTSSDMTIPVSVDGEYEFYVTFEDDNDNAITEKDFYTISDTDENQRVDGVYAQYVYKFQMKDDAPIEITARNQGAGYKGVTFTGVPFDINAEGFNKTYTLYYNASKTAKVESSGWVEIPKASTVKDKNYNENGYDYAEVKKVNFNGEMTFVPTRIGSYKIVCSITSNSTTRSGEATALIRVLAEPTEVNPNKGEWVGENKVQLIFLSIGAACLAGIVVLLCIKPKDNKEED